jgi:hypothetical protein
MMPHILLNFFYLLYVCFKIMGCESDSKKRKRKEKERNNVKVEKDHIDFISKNLKKRCWNKHCAFESWLGMILNISNCNIYIHYIVVKWFKISTNIGPNFRVLHRAPDFAGSALARRARMRKVFMVDLRWQLLDWLLNCVLVVRRMIVGGWLFMVHTYL